MLDMLFICDLGERLVPLVPHSYEHNHTLRFEPSVRLMDPTFEAAVLVQRCRHHRYIDRPDNF